jgi:hypothetical protein
VTRQILLLVQEEYPNPCDPIYHPGKLYIHMDLGEVVEINYPDFALTTPSPPADKAIRPNCRRSHLPIDRDKLS